MLRLFRIATLLLFALSASALAENIPPGIPGTYKWCAPPGSYCNTIELRTNGTFRYTPLSTFVVWEPLEGSWRLVEPNLLLANSTLQPEPATWRVSTVRKIDELRFCVIDEIADTPILDARVAFSADGISSSIFTKSNGCISMPRYKSVTSITVSHCGHEPASHENTDPEANFFKVKSKSERPYVTNQKWLLHDGKLYLLAGEPLKMLPTGQD
ncbi:MAG: hypothetical protein GY835_12845 [bacterium]|nr:hypothetical protein [bacterium]